MILSGRKGKTGDVRNLLTRNAARLADYARYRRLYDGELLRQSTNGAEQVKEIAFALAGPIVNIGADFLAGSPLVFSVRTPTGEVDEEGTKLAAEIWERSGAESRFLIAAINGAIDGDIPILIRRRAPDDEVVLRFPRADTVFPSFDPDDMDRLWRYVMGYMTTDEQGNRESYYEEFEGGTWFRRVKGVESSGVYDADLYDGGVPCVWVRNLGLGEQFGRSDLKPLKRLLERYDHASEKEVDIVDYFSSPNVIGKGIGKLSELIKESIPFGFRRFFSVPKDASIEYLEWKGDRPDVEKVIEHLRSAIAEVAETPTIAFGKLPQGLTQISGVALKILYGPLIVKNRRKRAQYGPALERAMCYALRESGHAVENPQLVDIEWTDPTPANEVEKWETALAQEEAGVSRAQVLRERGYNDEKQKAMSEERDEEQQKDAENAAAALDAGNVRGDPRNPTRKAAE